MMDLDRIEALAEKATPGPWRVKLGSVYADAPQPGNKPVMMDESHGFIAIWPILAGENSEADAAYIAALDPQTVLALVAAARALPEDPWVKDPGDFYYPQCYSCKGTLVREENPWHDADCRWAIARAALEALEHLHR